MTTSCPFKRTQPVTDDGVDVLAYWFDAFWALYPRRVGKHKAQIAFRALRPSKVMFLALMQDVDRRKTTADWTNSDGMYIPYPASYLHGKRWEDERLTKPDLNVERLVY